MVVTGSFFILSLIVPNDKNVSICPQLTRNFGRLSSYPVRSICEWIRLWTADSNRDKLEDLSRLFPPQESMFSFPSACTFNTPPERNETLNYVLHFLSEVFALILPEQVFPWVNNLERHIPCPPQPRFTQLTLVCVGHCWLFRSHPAVLLING